MRKLTVIQGKQVLDKGLDWVRQFEEFEVRGNHYVPYESALRELTRNGEYRVDTQYFGNSDQGSTISTFTKITEEEIKREEEMRVDIVNLEKKYNIKLKIQEDK